MSATPGFRWNVVASWLGHAVALATGFCIMPYVVRILGDGAYGSWVFINAFASYAALLYFGFGSTICRYVAKHQTAGEWRKLNEIVSLIFAIYTAMGLFALLVATGFAAVAPSWRSEIGPSLFELRIVVMLLGLNVAAGMAGSVFGGVLMGVRRFDLERIVGVVGDIVRLVLVFVFLRQTWGLATIAAIYLAITVSESLAFWILARWAVPQMEIRWRYLSRTVFHDCFQFSGFAFLHTVAGQLMYATDTIVIGLLLGTEAIVPYYIALRLTQFIRQPILQIGEVCLPSAGALATTADRRRLHGLVLQAVGLAFLLTGGMLIGATFFGGRLIEAWMGPRYPQSHLLVLLLLGAQVVALPVSMIRSVLFGTGDVRRPALIDLAEAVTNLILSVILCHWWGLYGVALGTALPIILFELGALLPYGLLRLELPFRKLVQEALWPQAAPLAALFCYSWIVNRVTADGHGWLPLVAITLGGGLVLGSTWLLDQRLRKLPAAGV